LSSFDDKFSQASEYQQKAVPAIQCTEHRTKRRQCIQVYAKV